MVGPSSTMSIKTTMVCHLALLMVIFCFNNVRCEMDKCNFWTCGECISSSLDQCVWCAEDVFTGARCRSSSYVKNNTNWCKPNFIKNPQPEQKTTQNQNFGEIKDGLAVQFRPQRIIMKTRPGVSNKFQMSFKPAKDFPLDVYYLMDISKTMERNMGELKKQARQIYKDLSAYTNNVQLGIGSFVEKPGFPYFDPNRHTGHAFMNHVKLTNNMTQFTSMIDNIVFGSNFDDPEAGLDGLMQAMKCEDQVGWRKGARRIIVLCTDSTYHSAGDGKIVGAMKPHDMQCHLENNTYTEALTYDYPSVSQINKVARDGNFIIIFAIAKNNGKIPEDEYTYLAKQIVGARYAKLETGTGVIKLIKEVYEELANSVPIHFHAPDFAHVTIDQECEKEPKRNCESPHKQTVNITGTVTVKSCPENKTTKYNVTVYPYGLADKLVIDLDLQCECDCEKIISNDPLKAEICNGAGRLQCGVCKCEPGSYGFDCKCNGNSTVQTDYDRCKFKPLEKPCSGRGNCSCGVCESCDTGFSGAFCEFDDNSCPWKNGLLCSGKGSCEQGQCKCNDGWTKKDCSCPDNDKDCYALYSKEVCSGRGKCVCGVCQCDVIEGKNETYSGAFCDSCDECAQERCKELEDYAYCNYNHMNDKAYCDKENNKTTNGIRVSFVNRTEFNGLRLYLAKWCMKELDSHNGTFMVFKYEYENSILKITIQKEVEVPPEANIWIAVGTALGLVLLIGILTVIVWKILVDIHDKKEYQKFKDEAASAGYDVSENPLYQDPSINFSNPVYNNQCN